MALRRFCALARGDEHKANTKAADRLRTASNGNCLAPTKGPPTAPNTTKHPPTSRPPAPPRRAPAPANNARHLRTSRRVSWCPRMRRTRSPWPARRTRPTRLPQTSPARATARHGPTPAHIRRIIAVRTGALGDASSPAGNRALPPAPAAPIALIAPPLPGDGPDRPRFRSRPSPCFARVWCGCGPSAEPAANARDIALCGGGGGDARVWLGLPRVGMPLRGVEGPR